MGDEKERNNSERQDVLLTEKREWCPKSIENSLLFFFFPEKGSLFSSNRINLVGHTHILFI